MYEHVAMILAKKIPIPLYLFFQGTELFIFSLFLKKLHLEKAFSHTFSISSNLFLNLESICDIKNMSRGNELVFENMKKKVLPIFTARELSPKKQLFLEVRKMLNG